jgi:uncharacterized membrane protein YhiD involved in acid resistance
MANTTSQTFEQFIATQTPHIELHHFVINLIITALLASILAFTYRRCGSSVSNRNLFSKNLVLIAMTTMLIITIVKSSLALSLGLVGALSIVRFRTPIKEPEELSYLFLSIAVGLALGAGQRLIGTTGFLLIIGFILIRYRHNHNAKEKGMHLTVAMRRSSDNLLDQVVKILEEKASTVTLRRIDENADSIQGDFYVSFDDYTQLSSVKDQLREIDDNAVISLLDNRLI